MWYSDWLGKRGEAYTSLADAIEQAIHNGHLPAGTQLPTHRGLAIELGVAVSTVSRAYGEATRRGLIEGTAGRGTFVRADRLGLDPNPNREGLRPLEKLYLPFLQREDAINLSLNEPMPVGAGERLRPALAELAKSADLSFLAHYQPPQGEQQHREAGVAWLREMGVDSSQEDVFAVSGSQTALITLFLALARPGDAALAEELTWPGAISVARLTGIRVASVAIDREGMIPEAFERACREHRPRFVYTMPTLHNPTTAIASRGRREDIIRIAREHSVWIVEDDAYGFLVEPRVTSYKELAADITVYLTSLSKAISPALRVGYMSVPARLHRPLRAATRATTATVSPILLQIAAQTIRSGAAHEAIAFQSRVARERQALAARILDRPVPAIPSFHWWLKLPSDIRNSTFVAAALARGVTVTPGEAFTLSPSQDPGGVRLCLCAEPSDERVQQALSMLADLLASDHADAIGIV
jgi:DNA-binding transcriptional MocR family regulator